MTTSIHLSDATFTKYSRQVLPPYVTNCLGYWLFGDTEAKSLTNRLVIPAAPLCTKTGTVTVGTNYVSVANANTNGYKSGITRSGAFTMAVVHKADERVSVGHQNVGTYDESGLYYDCATYFARLDSWVTNRGSFNLAAVPGWAFAAFTYADPVPSVYRGVGSGFTSAVGPNYSQTASSTEFRLGATGVSAGPMTLAAGLYYDRALSAAELLEVYQWLKGDVMPRRSITLL